MTFYYFLFAIYILCFEFGVKRIKLKFYLMNFAWGKALMNFFLGTMIISAYVVPPIDIPASVFFFLATIVLIIISVMFRKEEKMRVDKELQMLREYREQEMLKRQKALEEKRDNKI